MIFQLILILVKQETELKLKPSQTFIIFKIIQRKIQFIQFLRNRNVFNKIEFSLKINLHSPHLNLA